VWLDAPLEVCAARLAGSGGRPLWVGADPVALRALFERRRAAYALAALRVPAEGDPEATTRLLLGRLSGRCPVDFR
jgi:shikimate kinase